MRVLITAVCCVFVSATLANPPFETDDPGVFPVKTGEAYFFSSGGRSADGTELDAAPGMEVNYSFLPGTFAHLVIPMGYNNMRDGRSAYGLGNIELGFKWQFMSQQREGVDVATFPLVELPTGSARRGLGSSHPSYFLPIWVEKDWGPWTVYGGGGRWFQHDPGQRDWWYAGVLVQRQLGPDLYLGGEVFHKTAQDVGGRASSGFNVGGGYTLSGPWQMLFSFGRNLTNTADNQFSYYLALYRSF